MGKRVILVLSALLVIALAIMGYFLQQGRKTFFTDPFKAISPGACVVIETVDLQSFLNSLTTGKGLFGETAKVKEFEIFNQKLKYIADQLNKPDFKKLHTDGPAIISFYRGERGTTDCLVSMALPGEVRYGQIKESLNSSGIRQMIDERSGSVHLLRIPYTSAAGKDTVYISFNQGLMLISSSEKIIREAGFQMTQDSDVRDLAGFSRVLLASGKNEDKIFVVFRNLPDLLKPLFSGAGTILAEKISKLAGTTGADIFLNEDGLVLSGYTESSDSSEILYSFKTVTPRELQTYKILPSATVLFETIILPEKTADASTSGSISPETISLASKLKEYTGSEITRAYIDIRDRPVADNMLVIYELNNRVQAQQVFIEEMGPRNEVSYFAPDDQIKIPVYKTDFSGLVNAFFPGFAPEGEYAYFTFYDNYMITGNSFVTISRFLYDNMLNKTLANDLNYRDFKSTLPSRAGYFFYCVPARITEYLALLLDEKVMNPIRSNINSLRKIQAAGYQLASSNGMIYNSLSVRYKEIAQEESPTEWETLLDTTASIKPFFFTNHITGAKEIFIQDLKNNTYLINAAGRVLWKVPLNEQISGNIYMIDYFHNGKYQLLFSGRNYLHLLDRNGNYVERYPVKLRSPASNPLALVDYDNNLNYRLFIAGEDKMVYSYEKSGNVVRGWTPFRTAGSVLTEICYFRISGKDYIVVSDESSLYFLDRSGKIRVTLKEPVTRAKGSALRLNPGSESFLTCTSPDGTVQQIWFDGTVKKFTMRKFSSGHSFDIFDVDGNGFGEYIFIDSGMLYLYNYKHTRLFSRDFGSTQLGGPINFVFSASDRKIGVYDINKKLIYLVDKDGNTMNGFPLKGASMFSIGKLSDKSGWHLIVGGTDRFLYNYKIDSAIK